MAKNKFNKEQILEMLEKALKSKKSNEIKKVKRAAMHSNIKLGNLRKKFCKKCFSPLDGKSRTRIKNKIKIITCQKCGFINRWKIKTSSEFSELAYKFKHIILS